MAELNFGLLTPPGSQSIGNAFVQGMDQAAVARAQENQNALAQYTLGKAKREDELNTQLLGDLRNAKTPEEIYSAYRRVGKPEVASKMQSEALTQDELRGKILAQPGARARTDAETAKLQSEARSKDIAEVASLPDAASASAAIDLRLLNKSITQQTADSLREGLTPENFLKWKHSTLMSLSTPADQLRQSALTHVDTPRGGFISRQYFDAQGKAYGPEQRLEISVSPNTIAQINATRINHLETLAQQGWTFDADRGLAVNPRLGISKSISTLMAPVEPQGSAGGVAPAAPAAIPTAPSAAPAGTPITQPRAATAGAFPRDTPVQQTNRMEGATAIRRQELANEQIALENARQKLASPAAANDPDIRRFYEERFKEATNNIDALNKELGNQPTQPSAVTTQPAQRTVLGPKPEKATESYFKELKGVINTNDAINNLKQMVSTFTPADMLNPARRAEIDTAHKTAVLLAKEMFNLGVLNGGDQKILEQVIPDPISFSKGLVPIETIRKNLDAASSVASRMNATLSKVHKQPLVQLDTIKPNAPNTSAPPIESFRRR